MILYFLYVCRNLKMIFRIYLGLVESFKMIFINDCVKIFFEGKFEL